MFLTSFDRVTHLNNYFEISSITLTRITRTLGEVEFNL